MKRTTMKMMRILGAAAIGLAMLACGGDEEQAPPAPRSVEVDLKPSEGDPKPKLELAIEVSSEEITSFKNAAKAITQKNAEAEAAALMAEIEADIESGDDEIAK